MSAFLDECCAILERTPDATGGQDVTIRSPDAGELFGALGLFQGATGGNAVITGKLNDAVQGVGGISGPATAPKA